MSERKPKTFWKFVIVGWTLYGLFMSTQSYVVSLRAGRPVSWEYALFNDLAYAGFWASTG